MSNTSPVMSIPLFFDDKENIDFLSLEKYLTTIDDMSTRFPVYAMAYNTRYRMLSDNEVLQVNKFVCDFFEKSEREVYVGHPYTFNRRSLGDYFDKISVVNFTGMSMLFPERIFSGSEIVQFYQFSEKWDFGVLVHEMKLVSGLNGELVGWPRSLLAEVLSMNSVVAVKEDSKDDKTFMDIREMALPLEIRCILAGGGKRRMQDLRNKIGSDLCWLNGSSVFCPLLLDIFFNNFKTGSEFVEEYISRFEAPFFDGIVSKYGWHTSIRFALAFFGFGGLSERFPHGVLGEGDASRAAEILSDMRAEIPAFMEKWDR